MTMSVVYTTINGQIVQENRGGVQSFYAPDTLGSTAALMSATGTVTDTFTYWPYGEIENHSGSSGTPFTFGGTLGYYQDSANNFCNIRKRILRQNLTRWQTVDPFWPRIFPYGFADSNPALFVDPSGMSPISDLLKCIRTWVLNGYSASSACEWCATITSYSGGYNCGGLSHSGRTAPWEGGATECLPLPREPRKPHKPNKGEAAEQLCILMCPLMCAGTSGLSAQGCGAACKAWCRAGNGPGSTINAPNYQFCWTLSYNNCSKC